jgi:hypothetical protein
VLNWSYEQNNEPRLKNGLTNLSLNYKVTTIRWPWKTLILPTSSSILKPPNSSNVFTINPNILLDVTTRNDPIHSNPCCHDPSLGFMTKTRGMERCGLKVQLGSHIHTLGSAGKCEGMNPCIPKWAPILEVGVLMDSQIFREWFEGS